MTSQAKAGPNDADEVSVIGIAPLRDGTEPAGVGVELARAATEIGFVSPVTRVDVLGVCAAGMAASNGPGGAEDAVSNIARGAS